MERWDEPKFAAVEARLKALPEDAWAPEDYYQMVEWTAQRHLPRDEPLTERQWAAAKLRLKERMDAALEELRQGGDLGQAEWERRENERRRLAAYFSDRGRPFQADRGRQNWACRGGAGEARRNWFECS
ncbi:hypothetical protein [Roseateles sp.]|uniref:hypothetical protein n=1 Tax=Roseateles sp. TaxID=1971397 RepID=UPI0025F84543|nr:hypothetical protein [Roseateles sp.]MBV8037363.1 hypothetical protein [Roseateles sp.]